jgi:hypothetical protein
MINPLSKMRQKKEGKSMDQHRRHHVVGTTRMPSEHFQHPKVADQP